MTYPSINDLKKLNNPSSNNVKLNNLYFQELEKNLKIKNIEFWIFTIAVLLVLLFAAWRLILAFI